jgi:hypothetical protein
MLPATEAQLSQPRSAWFSHKGNLDLASRVERSRAQRQLQDVIDLDHHTQKWLLYVTPRYGNIAALEETLTS